MKTAAIYFRRAGAGESESGCRRLIPPNMKAACVIISARLVAASSPDKIHSREVTRWKGN
jgi:hypothetical protein